MPEFTFFSISELAVMPPPTWLINGLFEENTLVMVAGPPGSFKSFLVLDWALSMAAGRQWCGKETQQKRILYVLGEGKSSLFKRIRVWMHHNRLMPAELASIEENFKVTFEVPQMAQRNSVDNMLVGLAQKGYSPDVIIIDTFARSFVGMDENNAQDVGLWIESADRLRSAGYTVIFLHHTAKNTEFGVKFRGSSAIMGAMDTAMTMMREPEVPHGVKLVVTKQKDHDEGDPMLFTRSIVVPPEMRGTDGSIVLVPYQRVDDRYSEAGQAAHQALVELVKNNPLVGVRELGRQLAAQLGISEQAGFGRVQRYLETHERQQPNSDPVQVLERIPRQS